MGLYVFLWYVVACIYPSFWFGRYDFFQGKSKFIHKSTPSNLNIKQPLDKKQRELQEQREREIEEATDMGLVAWIK